MPELIDPYYLMRAMTLAIFGFWSVRGYWRALVLAQRWTAIGVSFGIPAAFIRRRMLIFALRITVLDPVNLALLATAILIWGPLFSAARRAVF